MAYLVRITARAERDLASIYQVVNAGEYGAGFDWYRGLVNAILSLSEHPERCPVISEDPRFRHLLYGNRPHVYRVIHRIRDRKKQVDVFHIRHGARGSWRPQ